MAAPDAQSLTKGFDVREFDLARDSGGAEVRFSFHAPKESRFATCGLWGCEPQFTEISEASGCSPKQEGMRLTNPTRCLLRSRVFRIDGQDDSLSRNFSFSLGELQPVRREAACGRRSALNDYEADYPVITNLSVGCWAYDNSAVLAATRLNALSPSDLPTFGDVAVDDCTADGSEGSFCYREPFEGACREGKCVDGLTPTDGAGAAGVAGTAGAPNEPANGGQGGEAGAGPTPLLEHCDASSDGRACQDTQRFTGRCHQGICANSSVVDFERPLVVSSCARKGANWLNCAPSPAGSIGTCFEKLCRQRCRVSSDCTMQETDATAAARWSCRRAEEQQYLGVCTLEDPAP